MPNWPEDPRRRNVYGDVYGQSLPMPGQSQLQGIPSLADLATLVSYQPPQQSGLPSPTFQQQQPSLGQLQPPLMPQSQQAASATDQPPKKPFFSLPDVANALYEGATQQFIPGLKGAAAQLYAGGERPDLQPEWVQRYQAEARAAQDQSQKRVQEQQAAGLSSSAGESIREAIPSLGFSLGSMAAALPAGIAGTVATGPIGGAVAAGAAAGAAGYRMAESQFLGDAFAKLEEESRKTRGRGLDEQEKVAAYRELKPIAEHTGLWEAGPEAIGNAAMFGLGRVALGFMPKEAMQNLAKTALGRVGIRAGAAAGAAGTEVATETATQVAQGNDQAKADAAIKAFVEGKPMGPAIAGAERPYDGLAGLQKAYNDVVGATLATVVMMGGLAKGAHLAYKPIANRIEAGRRGQEADTAVNQTDPIRTNLEFAREADIAEALARFDEIENTGRLPKSAARRIDAARQQLLGELSLRVSPESISAPMNSQRGMAGYLGFSERVNELDDAQLADLAGRALPENAEPTLTEAAKRYQSEIGRRQALTDAAAHFEQNPDAVIGVAKTLDDIASGKPMSKGAHGSTAFNLASLSDDMLRRYQLAGEVLSSQYADKVGNLSDKIDKARELLNEESQRRAEGQTRDPEAIREADLAERAAAAIAKGKKPNIKGLSFETLDRMASGLEARAALEPRLADSARMLREAAQQGRMRAFNPQGQQQPGIQSAMRGWNAGQTEDPAQPIDFTQDRARLSELAQQADVTSRQRAILDQEAQRRAIREQQRVARSQEIAALNQQNPPLATPQGLPTVTPSAIPQSLGQLGQTRLGNGVDQLPIPAQPQPSTPNVTESQGQGRPGQAPPMGLPARPTGASQGQARGTPEQAASALLRQVPGRLGEQARLNQERVRPKTPTGENAIPVVASAETPQGAAKKPLVLWGYKPGTADEPIKIASFTKGEQQRREKAGWKTAAYAQGTEPVGLREQARLEQSQASAASGGKTGQDRRTVITPDQQDRFGDRPFTPGPELARDIRIEREINQIESAGNKAGAARKRGFYDGMLGIQSRRAQYNSRLQVAYDQGVNNAKSEREIINDRFGGIWYSDSVEKDGNAWVWRAYREGIEFASGKSASRKRAETAAFEAKLDDRSNQTKDSNKSPPQPEQRREERQAEAAPLLSQEAEQNGNVQKPKAKGVAPTWNDANEIERAAMIGRSSEKAGAPVSNAFAQRKAAEWKTWADIPEGPAKKRLRDYMADISRAENTPNRTESQGKESDKKADIKPSKKAAKQSPPPASKGASRNRAINATVDAGKDSILTAIAKIGGLDRAEAQRQGIDLAEFKRMPVFGKPVFRKNGGKSFDAMAESLSEFGYPVLDEQGNYSPNVLLDAISRELAGNPVYTPQGIESAARRDAEEQAKFEQDNWLLDAIDLENAGFDALNDQEQVTAQLQAEASRDLGEDAADTIFERISQQHEQAAPEQFNEALRAAFDEARQRQSADGREQAGEPGSVQAAGAILQDYSIEELRAEEERIAKAQSEQEAKDKAAQQKTAADRARSDFVLTVSNRQADVAMARGQTNLLGAMEGRPKTRQSKPSAAPTNTIQQARAQLVAALNERSVVALERSGKLILHRTDPTRTGAAGYVDPQGAIHLIPSNMDQDALSVALHEAMHLARDDRFSEGNRAHIRLAHAALKITGLKNFIGNPGFSNLVQQLHRLAAEGNKTAIEALDKARREAPGNVEDEALAYLVQYADEKLPIVRRIIAAIRAALYRMGVKVKLTPADVRALALSALKNQARQATNAVQMEAATQPEPSPGVRYSQPGRRQPLDSPRMASKVLGDIGEVRSTLKPGERVLAKADPRNWKQMLSDLSADTRPAWLGLLTRNMQLELAKEVLPAGPVAQFEKAAEQLDADESKMIQSEGFPLADRWQEMMRKDRAQADAVGRALYMSTWLSVDPRTKAPNGKQAEWIRAKAAYDALNPAAKQLYGDVLDFYQKQTDRMFMELDARIDRHSIPAPDKKAMRDQLRREFERVKQDGPYAPLMRFGDLTVFAEPRKAGDKPVFATFESVAEQRAFSDYLKREGYAPQLGVKMEEVVKRNLPQGDFVDDLAAAIDRTMSGPEAQIIKDSMYQLFLRSLPEQAIRKHFMHRKFVPGYSADALRTFATFARRSAKQVARLKHGDLMSDALNQMMKAVKSGTLQEPVAAGHLVNELDKTFQWAMAPTTAQWASKLTSLGFMWHLGASPAHLLLNLSQQAQVTAPWLAGELHGKMGFGSVASALLKANKDFIASNPFVDPAKRSATANKRRQALEAEFGGDLGRALTALEEAGKTDKTQTYSLAGLSEEDSFLWSKPYLRKAIQGAAWFFHTAEVVNREASAIAAYRLGRRSGLNHDQAYDLARRAINESHFDYSPSNRARYMRGNVAKVLTLFKQYSLNISWQLGRNAYLSARGQSPEVRAKARTKLLGMLGMTAVMAGAAGMPFYGEVMWMLTQLMNATRDDDEPEKDADLEFRRLLDFAFDPTASEAVRKGLINAFVGVDFSSRIKLDDLWWRSDNRDLSGRDAAYAAMEQALGPVAGLAVRGYSTIDELLAAMVYGENARGDSWRAMETSMPKMLKDISRSIRYTKEGATTYQGARILDPGELNTGAVVGQALGFAPAALADQYEINSAKMKIQTHILRQRRALLDTYAMARAQNDDEVKKAAIEDMRAFNKRYPTIAITRQTLLRSMTSRDRRKAEIEKSGGVALDRRLVDIL